MKESTKRISDMLTRKMYDLTNRYVFKDNLTSEEYDARMDTLRDIHKSILMLDAEYEEPCPVTGHLTNAEIAQLSEIPVAVQIAEALEYEVIDAMDRMRDAEADAYFAHQDANS